MHEAEAEAEAVRVARMIWMWDIGAPTCVRACNLLHGFGGGFERIRSMRPERWKPLSRALAFYSPHLEQLRRSEQANLLARALL